MAISAESHIYAVILAGGTGARFWPLSRELEPKQLLSVFGTDSLIKQAISRMQPLLGPHPNPTIIVTNERLAESLRDHLMEDGDDGSQSSLELLIEPVGRNTAPALALVAADLQRRDPDAMMFVLPSDHLMSGEEVWSDTVHVAVALAQAGYFATIGLTPTRAETGYGYIEAGAPLSAFDYGNACPLSAARFVEKPDLAHAEEYLRAGNFFWNAGMFCMSAAQCLAELAQASAIGRLIVDTCRSLVEVSKTHWLDEQYRERFAALPAISIDTALMVGSQHVAVIPASLDWSDVGSLMALEILGTADAQGNIRFGRGVDLDGQGVTVYSSERLVATLGLKDMLVVDTRDATLICPKDRCQDVRAVVDALKVLGMNEVVEPCSQVRNWGSWTSLLRGDHYEIIRLEINPGAKTSFQRHQFRHEHWVVLAGSAQVRLNDELHELGMNEMIDIPAGATHDVANTHDTPLLVLEIQTGELRHDDIERIMPTPAGEYGLELGGHSQGQKR
jgi:mannose-1-phosphate guanylyltransferase/mannose-6-phosphate isomerase